MKPPRRNFLCLTAGAAVLPAVSRVATAQTYPTRPITIVVPFAAGGAGDTIARIVGERMRGPLGQPVIIENVAGAEGTIGAGRAARARPDGYTICLGTIDTHVLNGAFYSLQYNVLDDFAPIVPLIVAPLVLFARKSMPARDLNECVAWLKANPDKASAAVVTLGLRLVTLFFQRETSTRFALVPYRGGPPAVQDLAAGQIDLFIATPLYLPLVQTGSIEAYAVTSDARMTIAPDIPTFAEMGLPTLSYSSWFGLFAPRGVPKDVLGKLNAAAVRALADPAVRSRLADLGYQVFRREQQTPEALGALVKADAEKWWPITKQFRIKAE